jgi:outer membrane protein assembly factor BamB
MERRTGAAERSALIWAANVRTSARSTIGAGLIPVRVDSSKRRGHTDGMRSAGAARVLALIGAITLTSCGTDSSQSPQATSPGSVSSSSTTQRSPEPSDADAADWPTYHGAMGRRGVAHDMPDARGPLKRVESIKLDGEVLASPIIAKGLTIVATENDSVYAFDQAYRQVWKRTLGSPSPAEERQCGNIDPLGITGTPVYDKSTDRVYVVAEHGGSVRHELYALDLASGALAWSRSVDLPGVSARDMQQRGALAVADGRVWVSYGAQAGDCGNYKGRVVGVRLDGKGTPVFYSPPTERGGGIWNPNGPTVDSSGHLWVVSANGAAFPGDTYDHTNSVLKLDGSAKLLDAFAPSDWAENNRGDVGLGSQGVALVGTKWAVLGGKSGPVYVLDQDHLGGIGGQVDVQDICESYGGAAVDGDVVYLPCLDGVRAVRVDDAGKLHVRWHADESITGSPVVGGGRVWAMDTNAGILHALDPSTGRSLAQAESGVANRFATPALHGREVIVPTLSGISVLRTS